MHYAVGDLFLLGFVAFDECVIVYIMFLIEMFLIIGCKAIPKDSRNGRGREQSGIRFDW